MKKYVSILFWALFASLTVALASCGDDDKPGIGHTVMDSDLESSGSITVNDGSQTYTRKITDAGFELYKTDLSEKFATLRFRAFFESEGSPYEASYIGLNNNRIKEISFYRGNVKEVGNGEIADGGDLVVHNFYKEGSYWTMSQKNGWFDGKVEIIQFDNNYITVRFTDCMIEVSGKILGRFSGEIKFARRNPSFFIG